MLLILASALAACAGAPADDRGTPPPALEIPREEADTRREEEPFLGVAYRLVPVQGRAQKKEHGYRVLKVVPDSAAARAGLQPGDVLLRYDGRRPHRSEDLRQYLLAEKQVGDTLRLEWRRSTTRYRGRSNRRPLDVASPAAIEALLHEQENGETMRFWAQRRQRTLRAKALLGRRGGFDAIPDNAALFPAYEKLQDGTTRLLDGLFAHLDLQEHYQQWRSLQAEDEKWDDGRRLPLVRYLRRDPLKMGAVLTTLSDELQQAGTASTPLPLLLRMAQLRGAENNAPAAAAPASMKHIIAALERAARARQRALADLDADAQVLLRKEFPALLARFVHSRYLDDGHGALPAVQNQELLALAAKVDLQNMTEALLHLATLTQHALLQEVLRELEGREPPAAPPAGVSGSVWYAAETSAGRIVVGGPGSNRYLGAFALILDAGGDDVYLNDAGRVSAQQGIAVILDLAGNDEYSATENFAQGSGFLGAGLLADFGGDDTYRAASLAQGTALLGGGLLLDASGNDTYIGQQYVQGFACFGIALLLDSAGDDRYEAGIFAQGTGGPDAAALLMDRAGADFYSVGGLYPSTYGTGGIFQGAGQGLGVGFRFHASGGLGLLLDGGGADRMEAGNFAQGTGYFYALGLLRQFGTQDDTYIASRYGQGSSAHSALGAMLEDGGDDRYLSSFGSVVQGAAWDLAAALFLDSAGDDIYGRQPLGFSQGAGAKKGFGLFLDAAGSDRYHFDKHPGSGAPEDFDLSVFIDAGPGTDRYLEQPTGPKTRLQSSRQGQVLLETSLPLAELPQQLKERPAPEKELKSR